MNESVRKTPPTELTCVFVTVGEMLSDRRAAPSPQVEIKGGERRSEAAASSHTVPSVRAGCCVQLLLTPSALTSIAVHELTQQSVRQHVMSLTPVALLYV